MKSTAYSLSIIVLGFIVQYFFPWWTIAIVCFLVAFYFNKTPGSSYALAFASVGLLWSGYAGYINFMNGGVMLGKMQALLMEFLKAESGFAKGFVNLIMWGLLGSLVGGFGALTGVYARRIINPVKV